MSCQLQYGEEFGGLGPISTTELSNLLMWKFFLLDDQLVALKPAIPGPSGLILYCKVVQLQFASSAGSSCSQKPSTRCSLCDNEHCTLECNDFRKKTPAQRKQFPEEKNLCFNCFGKHICSDRAPRRSRAPHARKDTTPASTKLARVALKETPLHPPRRRRHSTCNS